VKVGTFKSVVHAALILCSAMAFFVQHAHSQQFSFSEKGKKQPASVCFAAFDHFDGTTLWLKQSNPPPGSTACAVQPRSSLNWKIQIQISPNLDAFQQPGDFRNPFNGQGPNVVNPGRIASSIGQDSKDVDLQRADLQNAQKQDANSRPPTPPDVDLTSCKTRGTDVVQTTINGSLVSITGTVTNISGGWVYVQKSGQSQPQKFQMLPIVSITIGGC
jgi:hypothetical protein